MTRQPQISWVQIADSAPMLQPHMQIFPQDYRGARWYVLHDAFNATHLRFNESAYAFIGLFDGVITINECLQVIRQKFGPHVLSQAEVVTLLAQLFAAGALAGNVSGTVRSYFALLQGRRPGHKNFNPLAVRVPLFDPDRLLNHLIVFVRPLFSKFGLAIWLVFVGTASLLGTLNYSAIAAALSTDILKPDNLVVMVLLYTAIKLVHEFAHALTVKMWGGEVHEMGFTLLIMVPVPHVDATAAWAFRDKYKRVLVGAAGIMAELFIAAVALFVWLAVEPGVVRDTALNIVLIASISTLLFNANPLLRFDGYYMLQDLIEIPNLGSRANRYYLYLVQRYLFGLANARSPQTAIGERFWFACYAPAALLYRLVVIFAIVTYLVNVYLVVGVALAAFAISSQFVFPMFRGLNFLLFGPALLGQRRRAFAVILPFVAVLVLTLGFWPVALTSRADGVVWVPDQAQIFASTEGFIEQLLVTSGAMVEVGEPLLQMGNSELAVQARVLEGRLKELRLQRNADWRNRQAQSQMTETQIETLEGELSQVQQQMAALLIRSQVAGRVVLLAESGLAGTFLQQGQLLGYVASQDRLIVRSMVAQANIGLIRQHATRAEIRLAERPNEPLNASIIRETPAASSTLPSAALGTLGGGDIPMGRAVASGGGPAALEKYFQVDLALPAGVVVFGLGGRAYVRFEHGSEPLAQQWLRLGRQLLLSHLTL